VKDGRAIITSDNRLICEFFDIRKSGKYNLTLFINNEDMKDRVRDQVILYTEEVVANNLKLISPEKLYFNLTNSLTSKNISIEFEPQGPLISLLEDETNFSLRLLNRTYT
jgi:hypothetical protein